MGAFDLDFIWFMAHYFSAFLIAMGIGILGIIALVVLLLKL